MIRSIQLNKLNLDKTEEKNISEYFKEKLTREECLVVVELLDLFIPLSREHLNYMDCCLPLISETNFFFQLNFETVKKILSRSTLLITSEEDVLRFANAWLNYDLIGRSKFARSLLLTVRLPLLRENKLKSILKDKSLSFWKNKDCVALINEVLNKTKKYFYKGKSSEYFTSRYCQHERFNVLVLGGKSKYAVSEISQIKISKSIKNSEVVSYLVQARYDCKVVCSKSSIYIFSGIEKNYYKYRGGIKFFSSVERYNALTNTCKIVADVQDINPYDILGYSVCAFDDSIFLIGGDDNWKGISDYCYELNLKDFSWQEKSRMREARESPSSCVFEGRIIVTGGLQNNEYGNFVNYYDNILEGLVAIKTCECFDPVSNVWVGFPSMNFSRCYHQSVVIKNKFYVIGGGTEVSEVYDSTCKKFTALKKPVRRYHEKFLIRPFAAFSIGSEIYIIHKRSTKVLIFNYETNKWYEKPCQALKGISRFASVKVPYL